MIPPLLQYAAASAQVTELLGNNPLRFWPFGDAPQPGHRLDGIPYAVWQLVYGAPDNYVNQQPDADGIGVQVDAYGATATEARQVLIALRGALEPYGLVTAYNGEDRDPPTKLYRASLTIEFSTDR
jgi:hypothetical protein